MWMNPETGETFTVHAEIRRAFPGFSFPAEISNEDLMFAGLVWVDAPAPKDGTTERPTDDL